MAMDSKTPESLPEEIQELERLLEGKKRALAERGEGREPKEIFRETFRERYGEEFKIAPPASRSAVKPDPAGTKKGREAQIQSLVVVSFERGIRQAIQIAKNQSPWLLDELHDRLIDEYYQKLVQSKQISE